MQNTFYRSWRNKLFSVVATRMGKTKTWWLMVWLIVFNSLIGYCVLCENMISHIRQEWMQSKHWYWFCIRDARNATSYIVWMNRPFIWNVTNTPLLALAYFTGGDILIVVVPKYISLYLYATKDNDLCYHRKIWHFGSCDTSKSSKKFQ